MVDPAFHVMLAILLGTTANHARRENGETSKLRLRLHGKSPIRRRASPARPTPREGHPSDGSPKRESSRNGQAGRSNRNNLGLLKNYPNTPLESNSGPASLLGQWIGGFSCFPMPNVCYDQNCQTHQS